MVSENSIWCPADPTDTYLTHVKSVDSINAQVAYIYYKLEIPHPYSGELIFLMCPLDAEGGLFRPVISTGKSAISKYNGHM